MFTNIITEIEWNSLSEESKNNLENTIFLLRKSSVLLNEMSIALLTVTTLNALLPPLCEENGQLWGKTSSFQKEINNLMRKARYIARNLYGL